VIPLATQLDLLIDMLEDLNREVQELRRGIIPLLPLPPKTRPIVARAAEGLDPIISDAYFRGVRALVQDVEDAPMNLRQNLIEPARANVAKAKKVRTKNQKKNDKLQSQAFANANRALRKTNGQMRKGVSQADIARRAQRELRKLKKKVVKRVKR
jgi:hypothetical protein